MTNESGAQSWFAGIVITRSHSDSPSYSPMFEESVILVLASQCDEAGAEVRRIATSRLASFKNEAGELIEWSLERVVDVRQLDGPPVHGSEVYSRHFRDFDAYQAFEPMLSGSID